MLMLAHRVLGTCCVLLLKVLCKMKKLIGGVKRAFPSGRPAEALAHAPLMDHKILHGLHPSCHHRTRPAGQSAILHTTTFLWSWTTMTSPSIPPRRWRSTSPSAIESLLTLVSMMWTYLRGMVWTNSFPPSFGPSAGENSTTSLV
jgi:hypothetical protein